jgi:cytidine deaminase
MPSVEDLVAQARNAGRRAYAPYSRFRVGAAVRDASGAVFSGCNVESASYGLSICAERAAIFAAVVGGAQRPLTALALACLDAEAGSGMCTPCGACRQVMVEHLSPDALVHVDGVGEFVVTELLPQHFGLGTA